MNDEYEILETWNFQEELIASIRFASMQRPQIGRIINYKEKDYKIVGYIATASPLEANIRLYENQERGIRDCYLKYSQ